MARCGNEAVLKLVSQEALQQNTQIDFRLRRDLPDCKKINTKNYVDISGEYTLNRYKKPENRFECGRTGCVTTGLLMMAAADETVAYRAMFDATEFAAGVVTFYVYPDAGATFPITVTFMVSDADMFTDADVYTKTIEQADVTADGFVPVTVNLANTPDSVEGGGWTASENGAYFQLSANQIVGYSSISIYDSIDDFDLLEMVTIGCLTSAGGSFDLEVLTGQCQSAQYNDQVNTLNYPVTGTKISPNYLNLFPMMRKSSQTEGFDMVTVTKTVNAEGKIILPDLDQSVCGFITVQANDSCDVSEATYTMSSATSIADVDDGHFLVVKNTNGTTELVFNTSQAGIEMNVRYPKKVEVERWDANANNLNSANVSMTVPYTTSDGTKYLYVFDNVFVTGFPAALANTEPTFSFNLAIGRDEEGNFFYIEKIIG